MTTNISSINFKQPSFDDYLSAKTESTLPFRIRARIINTYERLARGANGPVRSQAPADMLESAPSVIRKASAPRVRLKPRIPKREITRTTSYRNSETTFAYKLIERKHSSGKARPTKRTKVQIKRVARTVRRFKGGIDDGAKL